MISILNCIFMNKRFLFNKRFERSEGRSASPLVPYPFSDVSEKNSQLLDYIFGIDPVTGHPSGDLAIWLSDKSNSEVKGFIQANLLKDFSSENSSSLSIPSDIMNKMRETINDDDIEFFSRNDGESVDDYANRLHDYFETERYKNALNKESARLKKLLKGSNSDS